MEHSISKQNYSSVQPLLFWVIKFTVILILGWVVFDKVIQYEDTDNIIATFKNSLEKNDRTEAFIICIVLMFANWILESYKWQLLVKPFIRIPFKKAVEGVLIGLATGIVTPSRIGEYGGRILNLPKGNKLKGLHCNFLSSLSQNVVNVFFGIFGAMYYIQTYLDWPDLIILSLGFGALVLLSLLLLLYFGHSTFLIFVSKWLPERMSEKIKNYFQDTSKFETGTLNKAVIISLVRYVVFVSQYALLLYYFGIDIPISAILSGVSLIFLLQSGIPLPPFLSMLARGEIAVVIWSVFSVDVLIILSATFSLWILNLLMPSIVGAIILVRKPVLS